MSAIGLRVGPFEIRDTVTVPGTGVWYRAERTGLTRRQPSTVLVRLLGPAPSSRELASLQREFDVLKSLDDPRFPRAVALYEGTGALAVDAAIAVCVSHVVEARLLGDVVMTPATLLDLALDLSEALTYAHQKGRVHGHLCPDNVALTQEGALQIWGMGDPEARSTFSWLAPERARGEAPTAATDQWSLAALMVAMVTGRTPWSAASAGADPRTGDVELFVSAVANQWPALGRLVRRMLDPNPTARFPSLHAVRLELLGLARKAGGTSDRRRLGAWMHRQFIDVEGPVNEAPEPMERPELPVAPVMVEVLPDEPVSIEVEIEIDEADDIAVINAQSVREPQGPAIHIAAASRATSAGVPGYSARLQDESMAVVEPDSLDEVPLASANVTPPPVRIRAASPVPNPDLMATEMVPADQLATEMISPEELATEMLTPEHETEMVAAVPVEVETAPAGPVRERVPAVHAVIELDEAPPPPATLRLSATPRAYVAEPTPTMPGMDLPEPQLQDEPLVLGDPPAGPMHSYAQIQLAGPPSGPMLATIELDDDWDEPRVGGGAKTVVPFTDPVFAGPSLGLDPVEVDEQPETDDTVGPAWYVDFSTDEQPSQGMPWDQEAELEHDLPRDFRIVRVAPWLATVATIGLFMLTVYNVAT